MEVNLSCIPGAFQLPRPDWTVIRSWVEANIDTPERRATWTTIATQWLDTLNAALGGGYRIERRERLLLFAPKDYTSVEVIIDSAESGLDWIVDVLGDVAAEQWSGPLVMLLFADAEGYCRYVSPFEQEREYFRSGARCFTEGYLHIALRPYPLETLRSTMLHELTHACLAHLTLPLWIEEGITQLVEEAGTGQSRFFIDSKIAADMRRYWQEHGLGDFWWGGGFIRDDEGQGHSYSLAEVLYRLIRTDYRDQLNDFLRHAHADDAGDSAAYECLGKDVAAIAGQFLGPGSWEPLPLNGQSWCRRGILYLSRKQFKRALSDFDEAIRGDPRLALAYANRGLACSLLGRWAYAITDYEQAIQIDPLDFTAHNNLAWILATCPEEKYRHGVRALEHANKACELVQFTEWFCLGTLAAAHAEVEEFEEAERYSKEALKLAPRGEQSGCKERLRLYRERKPYRDKSPTAG